MNIMKMLDHLDSHDSHGDNDQDKVFYEEVSAHSPREVHSFQI
jgi:hypothetical protein